jgi:hypothetical protein
VSEEVSKLGVPYCHHCDYDLTGVTESGRCPECGKPLVEVLARREIESRFHGKRYRSAARLWGLPVIDVALGEIEGESMGRARGIIAIGNHATGGLAIGGAAYGIVAIGGVAIGVFASGSVSIGLVGSIGLLSLGGLAAGLMVVGFLAHGLTTIGYIAQGGLAIGVYAHGKKAFGTHTMGGRSPAAPEAQSMFDSLSWFFGSGWPSMSGMMQAYYVVTLLVLAAAIIVAAFGLLNWARHRPGHEPQGA